MRRQMKLRAMPTLFKPLRFNLATNFISSCTRDISTLDGLAD
jgi:hypothetical protein